MRRLVVGISIAVGFLAGCSAAAPSTAPTQGIASTSAPSPAGAIGGTVHYQLDGAPATTTVDAVADGATVSGTAVTEFREGTHTVRLACATQSGDFWVLGGTVEQTTVSGASAGTWSAVIVEEGSPQQIAIWLSADPSDASDCEAYVAFNPADLEPGSFSPVESGTLVPPPDPAP
jgi:hypothetical protein